MAKRLTLIFVAALVLSMLSVGVAFANFGPHGGYVADTDACAACHRAHTSFASAKFTDNQGGQRYGLLVSGASSITEFCLACHGDNTPGASTNVQSGVFDAGPSASGTSTVPGTNWGVWTPYKTDSLYLASLNGGKFAGTTSTHQMESNGLPMWGSYSGTGDSPKTWGLFTCIDCHDPHGSSNYRILRDSVNNNVTVGGYVGTGTPNPWVVSNEIGYPMCGWDKGPSGATEITNYQPSYTSPKWANSGANTGISNWCAGCHTSYTTRNDQAQASTNLARGAAGIGGADNGKFEASPYNTASAISTPAAGTTDSSGFSLGQTGVGDQYRHRHPVNTVTLNGATGLFVVPIIDKGLPLEMAKGTNEASSALGYPANIAKASDGSWVNWNGNGYVGCLTCHFAHGTNATMTGWANAQLMPGNLGMVPVQLAAGSTVTSAGTSLDTTSAGFPHGATGYTSSNATGQVNFGVNPGFSSALLRYPNRGVCERCHNK